MSHHTPTHKHTLVCIRRFPSSLTRQVPGQRNASLRDRGCYNVPSDDEGLVHVDRIWKDVVITICKRLSDPVNPLNAELNPICHLLALLGAHHIFHVSVLKVKGPVWPRGVGRGIALLFHDRGTRRWVSGQQHAPAALYPRERPGTHFTGGWMGHKTGLDGWKISSPPGFDPGPSSP